MSKQPARQAPARHAPADPPREPFRDRALELLALSALIAVSAIVYYLAGPGGFSAVMTTGIGLFVSWKSRR